MVDFNQYYTSKDISDLLSKFISLDEPTNCLELSAGEGALLEALKLRWESIHCTTMDIDPTNHELLKEKFPTDEHYCVDTTSNECNLLLNNRFFDLAVCNPPFESLIKDNNIDHFTSLVFGDLFREHKKIRAEIAFLAMNILHLNTGGVLAIIVPELIVKGVKYSNFRSYFFSNFKLQYLVECKHKAFKQTEAKTYILFIKNEKPIENYFFNFVSVSNYAEVESITKIKTNDYFPKESVSENISSSRFEVIRGSLSGKLCKKLNKNYIHTTNMNKDMGDLCFSSDVNDSFYKCANSSDIIISRVGTRVLGRTNFVINGSAILSDCVFAVRFSNIDDKETFLSYWREHKDAWIEANATGTCARHITKINLSRLIESLLK